MVARTSAWAVLGMVCLLALGALASRSSAEAYRYTDDRGRLHFTDNLLTVPDRYRAQLEKIEGLEMSEPEGGPAWWPTWSAARSEIVSSLTAGRHPSHFEIETFERFAHTWGVAFLIAGLPWGLVTLGTAYHAFARGRFVWGITNLIFHVVSVPLYALLRLDELALPKRLGVLALWMSPFVVGALAFRAAIPLLSG